MRGKEISESSLANLPDLKDTARGSEVGKEREPPDLKSSITFSSLARVRKCYVVDVG